MWLVMEMAPQIGNMINLAMDFDLPMEPKRHICRFRNVARDVAGIYWIPLAAGKSSLS